MSLLLEMTEPDLGMVPHMSLLLEMTEPDLALGLVSIIMEKVCCSP